MRPTRSRREGRPRPRLLAAAAGEAIDVFDGERRRAQPSRKDGNAALEAYVRSRNPAQNPLDELIDVLSRVVGEYADSSHPLRVNSTLRSGRPSKMVD